MYFETFEELVMLLLTVIVISLVVLQVWMFMLGSCLDGINRSKGKQSYVVKRK